MPSSVAPSKAPALYKKSWDEDHLPEWATESFDYGGTFDASGAFHDGERNLDAMAPDEVKEKGKVKPEMKKEEPMIDENETLEEPPVPMNHFDGGRVEPTNVPSKFMDFLNDRNEQQPNSNFNVPSHNSNFNDAAQNSSTHIDRMKEVADLVANLIMEDEPKDVKVQAAAPGTQPTIMVDWFYLDPQGDTQGPFTAQDMSEWYKAGYFQESLMVRRSIDNAFMPLGQLVKVYGRTTPFMAATLMDPIQPPPPPPVELDPYRIQQQQQQQQQRMAPPQPQDVNGWNMMTPEQQILLLNMRLAHQRPPVPDPYVMKAPVNAATPLDLRRMMGNGANEFYQAPVQSNPVPVQPQEMDPIQQLLMQLQKTGGNGSGGMNDPGQWMKPAAPPQMMMAPSNVGGNNMDMLPTPQVMNQQQIPTPLNQNQAPPPTNNWNQAPMSIWDMPKVEKTSQPQIQMAPPTSSHSQVQELVNESEMMHNGIVEDPSLQFQTQSKSHESKKKKQKEEEKILTDQKKQQLKEPLKQNSVGGKKKAPANEKQQQQKKEERTTQPAAPAPWVGHQAPASGASLAKIQKTEAQRRQGEMLAQREREHQKIELIQKMEMHKNDGLKWAAPQTARVKTLDEIQAEEQTAAAIQREREASERAKRDAIKKESAIITNDVSIWNSTPHSMAWQQPKVWSGEQTSGSGFWEEPTKPSNSGGGKTTQMLSKSQTMATITTTKKQAPPAVKKQTAPSKRPMGEKKEKKDDNNNEFTSWCTRTLSSMNGNVDGKTLKF